MQYTSDMKSSSSSRTAIVIGAGAGGLATAALLGKEGFKVTLLEKNDQTGGRMGLMEDNGFRFDMGPSWYLMPDVFEKFFQSLGTSADKELDLIPLDPQYRIFFGDHTHVDIFRDLQKNLATFEEIEAGSSIRFLEFLDRARQKYDIAINHVLYKNIDTLSDFLSWELLKNGAKLGVFESMEKHVSRYFTSEKLKQIIQYTLVFLGGSPYNTPALYSLMTHIDFNMGVFYPRGGMYEITRALTKIAKKFKVEILLNHPVTRLETEGEKVTAVWVGEKKFTADLIISNADYHFTDQIIDDPSKRYATEDSWQKKTLAPSAFLLFLGVKGKVPEFAHHNLYFGSNWKEHFDSIFEQPEWPDSPSLYVSMPSSVDPSVAPKNHENIIILVPVASKLSETAAGRKKYAKKILEYIKENMGVDLQDRIVTQHIFSVTEFKERYNSLGGTALGLAHTLSQTAVFRPPNKSKKLSNLYYVGGNTVPGIGVPVCLISAELVKQRILSEELKRQG